ncbi:MAG: sialate O-acetylesterase [Verrucomicrobiales bacterium]
MSLPRFRITAGKVFFVLLGILSCPAAMADVRLPAIISDHMVLQCDMAVPVWGWADPGEEVAVSFQGQTRPSKAGADGKWRVNLEKLESGGPFIMEVKGKNTIKIEDVLVGEVWLASGQSNMAMTVANSNNAQKEIAAANFPEIRTFLVPRAPMETPQENCGGKWEVCSPATVKAFSAAAYFFARDLHQSLKAPVGFINSSFGGTPIEGWTSMEKMKGRRELESVLKPWEKKVSAPYDPEKALEQHKKQMAAWKVASEKRKAEGKPVGSPPETPVHPRKHKNHPANLFNGMIAPVIPYAIRGAIWYQGENSCHPGASEDYDFQLPLLIEDWRGRWGQGDFPFAWVQLPFFKEKSDEPNPPSDWANVREGMLRSLSVSNSGMVITIDTGDANNIHPADKQPVGKRLAIWAKAKVYGENIPYSGPLPAGHKIEGEKIVLSFTHTNKGLLAKGGELKGFAIAGADKIWHWADARIEGETVIVSSSQVKAPVAVRYGWADHPVCTLFNGAGLPASPFRTDDW